MSAKGAEERWPGSLSMISQSLNHFVPPLTKADAARPSEEAVAFFLPRERLAVLTAVRRCHCPTAGWASDAAASQLGEACGWVCKPSVLYADPSTIPTLPPAK